MTEFSYSREAKYAFIEILRVEKTPWAKGISSCCGAEMIAKYVNIKTHQ